MIIGIDLDDTINNLAGILTHYARIYNKRNNINHKIKEYEWDFEKAYGWNKKAEADFFKKYIKIASIEAKPKDNASYIINKLKEEGHKIIIITARNIEHYDYMYEITKEWLDKNNIKFDKLIINSKEKYKTCEENNVEVFIDDGIENCKNVYENLKISTYLFESVYNKNLEDTPFIKRVSSWKDLYYEIQKL